MRWKGVRQRKVKSVQRGISKLAITCEHEHLIAWSRKAVSPEGVWTPTLQDSLFWGREEKTTLSFCVLSVKGFPHDALTPEHFQILHVGHHVGLIASHNSKARGSQEARGIQPGQGRDCWVDLSGTDKSPSLLSYCSGSQGKKAGQGPQQQGRTSGSQILPKISPIHFCDVYVYIHKTCTHVDKHHHI